MVQRSVTVWNLHGAILIMSSDDWPRSIPFALMDLYEVEESAAGHGGHDTALPTVQPVATAFRGMKATLHRFTGSIAELPVIMNLWAPLPIVGVNHLEEDCNFSAPVFGVAR